MSITLYTAPDCLRCKIVKSWLEGKSMAYATVDFKGDATTFNAFYRANRPHIYRNPEGVEFPLFDDGKVIKQGSGEVIAYLLSGHELECCVTRSDLLHGWISGLYPSRCPKAQEDNFMELVRHLAAGGLTICLRVDGRNPALLEKLLALKLPGRVELNLPAHNVYEDNTSPVPADVARSVALVRQAADHAVRLVVSPVQSAEGPIWPTRDHVAATAKMLSEATGDKQLPCVLAVTTDELPKGMEALPDALMLKYRSASREFLFKIDVEKA